jgi:hypothetical protein
MSTAEVCAFTDKEKPSDFHLPELAQDDINEYLGGM